MDRWQTLVGCLALLLLIEKATHFSKAEDNTAATKGNLNEDQSERWSKPATAQRRQGDWIPVPCPGCQPIGDQSIPNSDRISSVLTPPARSQAPRLLPPPLPSESLYQQAATAGFLQTFQPPPFSNKGRQQQIPLQAGQFIQQPIQQPIHPNQQFNQQHHDNSQNQHNAQFLNQQQNLPVFQINPQAYTQQHAQLINPSLINTQQQSISPHFINGFISPIQQQTPGQFQQVPINIAENQQAIPVPVIKPNNFQNKPLFNQDSSTEDQQSKPQLTDHQRRPIEDEEKIQQQVYNNTSNIRQNSNEENEEVQLLYVPVEQLRQRGRNLGKLKQNNQFQTFNLPANVDHQTTNVPNNDNLNIPSSSGNSEVYQQNKQNSQFHEQNNFQYNQAALRSPIENPQVFSQNKPEVQYKETAQSPELGNTQGFSQSSPNIQYPQQTFSALTRDTPEIARGTQATHQLQPEPPQNNRNVQYDQSRYRQPSQEEIYRQQLLQKANEKVQPIEQSETAEDLPQATTSVYTTPPSKKHRFYKNKDNEPVNQLSQQQFIQETTHDILPKSQPHLLQSKSNSQNFNSELNNQQFTFETNNQRFHSAPNTHQFQQSDEQEFKTHSRQQIPSRQNEQVFQQQQLRTGNQDYVVPQSSTIPPPHQPPLSVYMESGKNSKVSDVLNLLKNAKTIPVLDTVGSESPQVFVGPSNLDPPNGYIKFELPYLSSLENNRVERKVDKLPFFVAPLNFNPPPGYSKIPFPAPHIGSVVVSNVTILREALHEKPYIISPSPSPSPISSTPRTLSNPYTLPADISPISPQLPSLVNSLQDEIYSPQDTTEHTTTTTTTTTEAYTTSSYRRNPSRGSHRGHSTYLTSTPTPAPRRTSSRTRRPYNGRPYSHRQPVTTSTTTPLPPTEETNSRTQFISQSEAQIYDTQPLFSQSNEQATNFKKGQQQYVQNVQQYDPQDHYESVEENNAPQRKTPSYDYSNQNIPQDTNLKTQQIINRPKTEHNEDLSYHNYNAGVATSTETPITTENIRSVPSFHGIRDENAFQSQRANNPRRENSLRNQRLRGRGHHRSQQTTTTEASLDSITTDSQDNPNTYQGVRGTDNYNLNENTFNYKNHKYDEQSDQADIKTQNRQSNYKYPIQTERSDIIQTTAAQNQYSTTNSNQYDESYNQPTSDKTSQQNENFNIKNEYVQHSQFQQPNFQLNINAQQQPQIQSNVGASKHIHQLKTSPGLHSNQDYSVQSQQTNQPQNVQTFNNNQKHLVETQLPQDYSPHQEIQSAQNYNSQAPQLINTKNNQQEYHDETQPINTKSIQTQNLEEQQYFAQFQPKETQPPEQQTNTQQRQQQIPQQVSQQQYQNNNQNGQRYQQVQNPKFVQDYQVNFQSQAANIAQNDFPTPNHHIRPTEVTQQQEASVEQDDSQQTVSQVTTIDDEQSIPVRSHNQQRLTKYTRTRGRNPINSQLEETYSDRTQYNTNSQDESQYQNSDIPVYSTINSITETTTQYSTTTTKSPLVRVRGRVRNRQRGPSRTHYTTTTEVPNYPANVLKIEYSTEQSDEQPSSSQYNPQKRVNKNYKSRQSYESIQDSSIEQTTSTTNNFAQQSEPVSTSYSTTEAVGDVTDALVSKPVRRYKHILNRNIQRRPSRPTQSPSSTASPNSVSSGTAKYLVRTTHRPPTRLTGGRARIRKPTTTSTTTTTEYPQSINPSWVNNNAGNNFAPSAASNEVIDPYYSNQSPSRPLYNYEEQIKPSVRTPVASVKPPVVKPADSEEYWNQAVTIQQSTSYDFKPDTSPVTQSSFQGTFEPDWDDQLSFKNDNYYDNYRPQSADQSNQESSLDQAPFPSNEQQVIYTEIKGRPHLGKENQWNEKELLIHKNPGNSESKESFTLEQTEDTLNNQSSQVKSQASVNEGEVIAFSENESAEKDSYGLYPENSSKGERFSDRITTSTEVDESLIKTDDETKPNDRVTAKKPGRRRGSWVRVRVKKPQDLFETAESQNLATLSGNAIQPSTKPAKDKTSWKLQEVATVPTVESTPEPEETVDFEDALKNMLKDFITQTDNESSKSNNTSEDKSQSTVNSEDVINKSPEPELIDTTDTTEHKETVMTTSGLETTTDALPTPELTTVLIPLDVGDNSQLTTDSVSSTANAIVYETLPSRVIGTSTTTEISLETEICYRGRCVKTKTENESDLLTAE